MFAIKLGHVKLQGLCCGVLVSQHDVCVLARAPRRELARLDGALLGDLRLGVDGHRTEAHGGHLTVGGKEPLDLLRLGSHGQVPHKHCSLELLLATLRVILSGVLLALALGVAPVVRVSLVLGNLPLLGLLLAILHRILRHVLLALLETRHGPRMLGGDRLGPLATAIAGLGGRAARGDRDQGRAGLGLGIATLELVARAEQSTVPRRCWGRIRLAREQPRE
mmetsp:Transcript_51564/g.164902  ORF Transcript_51564/g.164902 Transcript_51564/m.164902 type:complete len:222 (-) Transcript_51564:23-688(-)